MPQHTDRTRVREKESNRAKPKPKPKDRDDVTIGRAYLSTFIAKIQRPNLQDRERHVVEGHARGLSLESLSVILATRFAPSMP